MRKLWLWLIFAAFAPVVHAQTEVDFTQTELNAVFIIDEAADTTTALYSISYLTQSAETFTWVFPLPPGATDVEMLPTNFIPSLETATQPILRPPNFYSVCDMSTPEVMAHGIAVDSRAYMNSESGMLEVIDNLEELPDGLTAQQTETLQHYTEQGWQFAITSLAAPKEGLDAAEDDYQNWIIRIYTSPIISITFPGIEPVLPLVYHAPQTSTQFDEYSSENAYTATVYIAAQTPYTTNQPALEQSFSDLRGPNMIQNIHYLTFSPVEYPSEFSDYFRRLQQGANVEGAQPFLIESITDPQALKPGRQDNETDWELINQWIGGKPYLSRLRTIVTVDDDITPVIQFSPDESLDYFVYDTTKLIDPALYAGCTTESEVDTELESRLPPGRTYIPELHAMVAHPRGWQLSKLGDKPITYALAPQSVEYYNIAGIEHGQGTFPALVIEALELRYHQDENGIHYLPDRTWDWFSSSGGGGVRNATSIYFPTGLATVFQLPYIENGDYPPVTGYRAVLMTSPADWIENEALYNDMISYLRSYAYFTSPELRHTLMLGKVGNAIAIGYPEDWHTVQDETLSRLIIPEARDNVPYIRIYVPDIESDTLAAYVADTYDVEITKDTDTTLLEFQDIDGRSGYVTFADLGSIDRRYVLEYSAPSTSYETYAAGLEQMAQALIRFSLEE